MLRNQEVIALELIFRGADFLSEEIKERIEGAHSVDWEETGVGFYSKIKLGRPLSKVPDVRMWEYNFSHPDFPYGGSYMCVVIGEYDLELEGVALGGADWPNPSDSSLFRELV
ncbi:hypothetical protein GCM10007426_41580 [Alloalcanivorax dieselolei]|uniref:hypothetical protein n=1 Tax=Alloalcanivorax TaxID=3020832 RepID=UPI0011D1BC92|nr:MULTISPECIES: hypothetical protein [Alloalcanivorax]GGK09059.1 hypothetical protein GCM10007426_41580 [Alloalcanivorax dieselolei]